MAFEFPSNAVPILIEVARADPGPTREVALNRARPLARLNCLGPREWEAATETLTEEEHQLLAKGLVLAEEALRWPGGSVAAAIWVYHTYRSQFPATAEQLADWMLANSTNPWVPFGTNRGSATSRAEIDDYVRWRATARKRSDEKEAARIELSSAKEAVRKRLFPFRQRVQQAVSESRRDLILTIEALPARERLEHLAWDQRHPLSFYPIALLAGTEGAWNEVAQETRDALLNRAAATPRGEWRRWWRQRIESWTDESVPIDSRDYWFKIVDFLQHNWALIDPHPPGVRIWFLSDTSGVFDQIDYPEPRSAEEALRRNGFTCLIEDPGAATFLRKPQPPFTRVRHPNGPIYSSGRFWNY